MESNDRLAFKISIGDRTYPLRGTLEEQRRIQQAVALIQDKIEAYKLRYKQQDLQDHMAMASLQFATKILEKEPANDPEFTLHLQALNRKMDVFLNQLK